MTNQKANEILLTMMPHLNTEVADGVKLAMMIYSLDDNGADMEKVKKHTAAKLTKKKPIFEPKTCAECGKEFTPNNGRQKICHSCAGKRRGKKKDSIGDVAKDLVDME